MRWWRPWRLFIIWLTRWLPVSFGNRLAEYLYPADPPLDSEAGAGV